MATTTRPEAVPEHLDLEWLAHALTSRGLITREEFKQCNLPSGTKIESLLRRLVEAGFLTASQANRLGQELPLLRSQRIPGYQLLEKLGQGTSGVVFKARQLSMNRLVAVKTLPLRLAHKPGYVERFLHEARLAAKLSHNHIVQAIDAGSAGQIYYFVMEYVEGTTIDQQLEKGKIFGEREALEIGVQIAQAMEHAHHKKLVHRDIKPSNIIITRDGVAKMADLGIARDTEDLRRAQTEKGMVIGTPYYISPEQVQGRADIDIRADIYSLGATLYHMVTGRPPFIGGEMEILFAHLEKPLTPPDHVNPKLSAGFGEVIEFMLAKDRDERYRTPSDLLVDLQCLLAGDSPKLAGQWINPKALKALARAKPVESDNEGSSQRRGTMHGIDAFWVIVLGVLLGLSVLGNVLLLLWRR